MEKTTELGMDEKIEGLLCYAVFWVTGFVFYIIEKNNKFVRFHAMQSILVFLPLSVIAMLLGGFFDLFSWGPDHAILRWMSWALWAVTLILWVVLMLKAFIGEKFKLPIVGDIAEKNS